VQGRKNKEKSLALPAGKISGFHRERGRMPSFSEAADLLGFRSKNAVSRLVDRMQGAGLIGKDDKGKLLPVAPAIQMAPDRTVFEVRVLGTVEAGFPSPAEEELSDTISLDKMLIQNREATFLLKVTGDSMSGAGIMPGDMVIVDKSQPPRNGDVVIAEVDGAWTMKFLKKRGESVTLMPANPKYSPIKPRNELRIAGVVTAVVRKYR
jgi:repressor LexA